MAKAGKISLLIGVVTGAITGLLFAPQKGQELRKNIAKERQSGGLGHRAVAHDLAKVGTELTQLLQRVAHSDEAKQFWKTTHARLEEWTGGAVELDEWTQQAHQKIGQLHRAVNEYAKEHRKLLQGAKGVAKKTLHAVKKGAKVVHRKVKASRKKRKASSSSRKSTRKPKKR